jgi:hypothetical protein
MKKGLILILFSMVISTCSQKSCSQNIEWIRFVWEAGSDWGKYLEKMAIYIPVTIDELPYKFTMQLDLGTSTTCFYGKALMPFRQKHPSIDNKWDNQVYMFRNVDLKLGEVAFKNIDFGLHPDEGTALSLDSINAATEIEIGVIGRDFFYNKILIIDYKSDRFAITDSVPIEYQNALFETFETSEGYIKLPFLIKGNREYLMFDTGGSYFSLATTKQNALAIGGTQIIDSLTVKTWGERRITFYGLETVVPIMFGRKNMESTTVYYDETASFDGLYQSINVWGLTGNGYFLNDVVIIDFKNNRFGVK